MVFKQVSPLQYQIHSEAEREILIMLIGSNNADRKADIIEHTCADMFYQKEYKELYKTALSLFEQKKNIDVQAIIEASGKEAIRKLAADLNKEYITSGNYRYYCEKLHRDYFKRLLRDAESNEEFLAIQLLQQKYGFKKSTVKLNDNSDELIVDYFNKWGTAIQTYYPSIDKELGTLQGGDFLVLAGATGMGKTCFMLNLLMNMAKNGKKILLFSLEMPVKQLQNRIIASETGIDASKIRNFKMNDLEIQKYKNFIESEEFAKLQSIEVCTEYNITADKIRRITDQIEPDIVFIDYLGLVSSDVNGNSYEKVSQVSRDLKLIALSTNTPFIVLHQLNRIPAERKEKRPLLSDLRDSGKIEQDADFICFVYRDYYYNSEAPENRIEFILSKSRHGKGKAICELNFDGSTQKVKEINRWV